MTKKDFDEMDNSCFKPFQRDAQLIPKRLGIEGNGLDG